MEVQTKYRLPPNTYWIGCCEKHGVWVTGETSCPKCFNAPPKLSQRLMRAVRQQWPFKNASKLTEEK